ncbi:hypothetical protein D7D52_17450 [Nocardia yunnanensis]|uniref:Uncharacterized protein n=2 Tax=Nocardia yunnanensis TaxID=2382165 RepID=A0A386ZCW8_9NOCA|nr:hypothetical protein D7D52_17450 [Nocardia yunnanensis]
MARTLYADSPAVPETLEPSGWGRHLGVSDDIADGLYSDQLGALIFVRKLVRCGYAFNAVIAALLWVSIAVWARYCDLRTLHDCTSVPGLSAHCDPALPGWILGTAGGFVAAAVVFVLLSLPCFVVGYAVRWAARAMADRN